MKGNMEERAQRLALYMIENRATVRAAARKFGISKSTVHTATTVGNGFICRLQSPLSSPAQNLSADIVSAHDFCYGDFGFHHFHPAAAPPA